MKNNEKIRRRISIYRQERRRIRRRKSTNGIRQREHIEQVKILVLGKDFKRKALQFKVKYAIIVMVNVMKRNGELRNEKYND